MPPKILYVEDDAMNREVLRVMLKKVMGFDDVIILENSENFMQQISKLPYIPDLILLDIYVPPHSGYEMLKMLRANRDYATQPIIAVTASITAQEVQQLRAAGFDGLIGKPFSMKTFPELLNRILRGEKVWKGT